MPSLEVRGDEPKEVERHRLTWAGKGSDCVNTDHGWKVVEHLDIRQRDLWSPVERIGSREPAAIIGPRILALNALGRLIDAPVSLVYADLPRLGFYQAEESEQEISTWLTLVDSHLRAAAALLSPNGYVVVHIDEAGAAYTRVLLDEIFQDGGHVATAVWQKKYSPQNDLRGRIDDAHDFLFVYSREKTKQRKQPFDNTWWSYDVAGKTEDATREFEKLRNERIISLPEIPKTSKPRKLLNLILEKLTKPGQTIVEMFSDTGFASVAAALSQRVPVYLVGETRHEHDLFEQCGKPALLNAIREVNPSGKLAIRRLEFSKAPKQIKLNLKKHPIAYQTANENNSETNKQRQLRAIRISNPHQLRVDGTGCPSMLVAGSTPQVLDALEPVVRCEAGLAWCDYTSLIAGSIHNAALRTTLGKIPFLLQADGVLATFVPDDLYAPVKLICDGLFGRQQHVGTIAVQSNGIQHPLIVVYRALPPSKAKKVGLPANHEYTNPDGDPRGPWRDPGHKGARSGSDNTAFPVRMPPYRWELVSGKLPPGCWRINPYTGVIYACKLTQAGHFEFRVKVTDSAGLSSTATCAISVDAEGCPGQLNEPPFLFAANLPKSKGAPQITTTELPSGVVGLQYSATVNASGGQPFDATKRPGKETTGGKRTRYWEFSSKNLVTGVLEDRVNFGSKGESSPSFKVYEKHAKGYGTSVELGWWSHEKLEGEEPYSRLERIFTNEGDLIISAWGTLPRPNPGKRIIALLEHASTDEPTSEIALRGELSEPVLKYDPAIRSVDLDYQLQDFRACLCWLEGFLPVHEAGNIELPDDARELVHGVTSDKREVFHLLDWNAWPTARSCETLHDRLARYFQRIHVYYYRGDPSKDHKEMVFHRIPFGLKSRPKG